MTEVSKAATRCLLGVTDCLWSSFITLLQEMSPLFTRLCQASPYIEKHVYPSLFKMDKPKVDCDISTQLLKVCVGCHVTEKWHPKSRQNVSQIMENEFVEISKIVQNYWKYAPI